MTDLPDPKSPLNEMEKRVFGVDSCRHPITGYPIARSGKDSSHPAFHPNQQAYEHLQIILREHGEAAYLEMKRKLDEFVRNGGQVELPPVATGV